MADVLGAVLFAASALAGGRGIYALQAIPMLINRTQPPAGLRIEAELGAQLARVRADGARVHVRTDAPDGVEHVGARHQAADVTEQQQSKIEFLLRQLDRDA